MFSNIKLWLGGIISTAFVILFGYAKYKSNEAEEEKARADKAEEEVLNADKRIEILTKRQEFEKDVAKERIEINNNIDNGISNDGVRDPYDRG